MKSLSKRGRAIAPVLLLLGLLAAAGREDPEDWANSPQAYFLTAEERAEWKKLDSRDSRAAFQERYWLKRDPSPGSERNEFREMVLARIKTADARFGIEKTPGSRTARGLVFIVLGTPARVLDERTGPNPADSAGRRLGQGFTPVAVNEGNEATSNWFYEPDRTPRILETIGQPSLTIKIVVEPSRHLDSIQNPGLFNEIREIVARKSIVNPDMVPAAPARESSTAPLPGTALVPGIRKLLESPPPTARAESSYVGHLVLFPESGGAEVLVWVYSSKGSAPARFHALVRSEKGEEAIASSETPQTASFFSMATPGVVALRRMTLPPGSYSASVAATDSAGAVLGAAELPIQVPAVGKEFAVSSILISRGPAAASKGSEPAFTFSGSFLPPRADALFARSESLWYFIEIANPSNPTSVTLEPRLRRGSEPFAALPPFPAKLSPIGERRFVTGIELPLANLAPGDYVLYLRVRDGESEAGAVLRRADFRIAS